MAKARAARAEQGWTIRSLDERIADMQAKVARLKQQKAAKDLKDDPVNHNLLKALRLVEKAYESREDDEDKTAKVYVSLLIRKQLANYFHNIGIPQVDYDLPYRGMPPKAARGLAKTELDGDPDAHA